MLESLNNLFLTQQFIPHGHCYLWKPGLVWLHVVSDSLIALSYYSIPVMLVYFVYKRRDLPFNWIFLMFSTFIVACGTTHTMDVWTLWHPTYWLSGYFKVITAAASVNTAVLLLPLIPKALALPSPAQLKSINVALQNEIADRQQAELALERLKTQTELILNCAGEGIYGLDLQGNVTFANPAAARMVGWQVEELLGQPQHINIHHSKPDGTPYPEEECPIYAVFRDGLPRHMDDEVFWRKDGTSFPVEYVSTPLRERGEVVGAVVVFRDITDRKLSEATLQQHNVDLDRQVQERTLQLEQSLKFEAMLKRITDKVRDSLDESQILQTAVQELALVLNLSGCNAAWYNLKQGTSTICYEYVTAIPTAHGRAAQMADFPEIYHQLLGRQYFQFCSIKPHPLRGRVTMLACPILDVHSVLGDLWLIAQPDYAFNELEIRLVQQVANQCAIALRQARLYQAAKAQVEELEKLNALKDDFLSTVSHELRTPMTNIKMATKMLEVSLSNTDERTGRYLKILQTECARETELINDLLDLQQLEASSCPILLVDAVCLQDWLPSIIEPFRLRSGQHQQTLKLHLAPDLPQIVSHRASLERIFTELLNNACKYTPADGEIVLSVCPSCDKLAIAGDTTTILITISNSAEIAASELPRIFDKFYRVPKTDPWQQGGTGLGLALVQKLVERLKGNILVESSSGWTTFTIELP
jgi:PAS domain S-box-containing protein